MARIDPEFSWRFTLNGRETSLVLQGLRGAIRPEQEADALKLCAYLTSKRAEVAAQFADQMEVHAENARRE